MRTNNRFRLLPILCVAAGQLAVSCHAAVPPSVASAVQSPNVSTPPIAPAHITPRSAAESEAQVDGMASSAVDHFIGKGDYYWHHGDYPRIVALSRIETEADPQYVQGYANGGWLMDSIGDTKDAEAYYQLGVKNNPDDSFAAYQLAMFYYESEHDYSAVVRVLTQSVKDSDATANDWKILGHAYTRLHEYDKSLAVWKHIKQRWPEAAAVDHNLAEAEQMVALQNTSATTQPSAPSAAPRQ